MIGRLVKGLILVALVVAAAGWVLTRPATVEPERFATLTGDAAAGEAVFWAGGCASCHTESSATDRTLLTGGYRIESDFGTFVAPNISPDPEHGIGGWSLTDFANAMLEGTTPEGAHYFPSFPYGSYRLMADQDVADLWAYLQTLPPSDRPSVPHELSLPFNLRMAVGGWKVLYLDRGLVGPGDGAQLERGRYLVEALGHCAECHTPRDAFGGLDTTRWMAGAPNPSGRGRIPGLTPAQLTWSEGDIAYYLETGFTPDFDSAGGGMASVVKNLANLTPEDRTAIAAYLKALPAAE
ncbi:c-type cytochrome [Alphaproteobacteria bacterium GH1-50]|uniref:C-type cytochrome n=1 Tax=Kangsaoukella pontilimi TaxID=2691042 RepID=A0A7C9IR98_9RHOB|nr:cytochrome c [Kangsaoukella pontilimi]MXQ07266.1 c-type cytochrome [Kangsaoukella pontilimi]